MQNKKRTRYLETADQNHAELLPFSVETYGGMAPDAIKLLSAMGAMGEEQLGMWPRHVVIRHLIGSVATFVCLLLCIRLVGGFNGNTNKTRCWSAVCVASVSGRYM